MNNPRGLVWLGSVVLAATAAFHGSGYVDVTSTVAESNIEGMLSGAIGGLWLYPSVHWLFIAVLAIVAVQVASRLTPWILGLAAVILAADAIVLLVHVGPFVGEAMLGAAALAYAGGARLARGHS
ncbi:MAG: hypothetical protein GY769_03990 [bacterium]|nr:hypothetical protein [bacterium]